jgi:hypothetical protein
MKKLDLFLNKPLAGKHYFHFEGRSKVRRLSLNQRLDIGEISQLKHIEARCIWFRPGADR